MRDLVPFVQFEKRENTHGGVLLLVACNFSKSNTHPWVFFTFLKLCKCYQIAQKITNTRCENMENNSLIMWVQHVFS